MWRLYTGHHEPLIRVTKSAAEARNATTQFLADASWQSHPKKKPESCESRKCISQRLTCPHILSGKGLTLWLISLHFYCINQSPKSLNLECQKVEKPNLPEAGVTCSSCIVSPTQPKMFFSTMWNSKEKQRMLTLTVDIFVISLSLITTDLFRVPWHEKAAFQRERRGLGLWREKHTSAKHLQSNLLLCVLHNIQKSLFCLRDTEHEMTFASAAPHIASGILETLSDKQWNLFVKGRNRN